MKVSVLLLLITICIGCNDFELKKISSEDVLEEELHQMNWSKIDTYPTFEACESLSQREKIKSCFEKTLSMHFSEKFPKSPLTEHLLNNDTIVISLKIDKKGLMSLQRLCGYNLVNKNEIESWCKETIGSLPKIYPAQKRGVPVAVNFDLPIIIVTD
jgi:hypothetical protein